MQDYMQAELYSQMMEGQGVQEDLGDQVVLLNQGFPAQMTSSKMNIHYVYSTHICMSSHAVQRLYY